MSRLPTLTARDMIAALKRGGFVETIQKGSHVYLRHRTTGRTTSVPMHPGDMPRPLVKAIIRQAGLSEESFRELV